jgi:hypothetical protein
MLKLLCLLLVLSTGVAFADGKKLVVVVAKTSTITNISRLDLKRSFLGDKIEINNGRLIPFNAEPSTDARAAFDRNVLGMSVDQVGRFWVDRKVRGEGAAPRSLPAVHLAKVVAKFPGAISYLPVDQLTPDVKALTIDGIAYTDPRYSLVIR